MNDTINAIQRRYACRAFSADPIAPDSLSAILEAGLHAPSGLNRQPWRVIAVTDPDLLAFWERIGLEALRTYDPDGHERIMKRGGTVLYHAPAVVVVAAEQLDPPHTSSLDAGIVVSHLALAATALGIDNCVVALPGLALSGPDGPELRRRLLIPDGFEFAIALLLGHAAAAPRQPHAIDPAKLIKIA
ncbi:MAG: nitroreductase family protein [Propionibacteriaceae bacterium]|jgi:nitroreductase|nr:nitroreductase family protein [Propionibacteriaceae bacterium]